jgi:mannose-6-phosphate isomerase-like protein (cupin superfamily)
MNTVPLVRPPQSRLLKGGRVTLSPGEEVGEHVTENREEIIVVLRGTASLLKGDEIIELNEGEAHFIEEGTRHNVRNSSDRELEYIYAVTLFR